MTYSDDEHLQYKGTPCSIHLEQAALSKVYCTYSTVMGECTEERAYSRTNRDKPTCEIHK